MYPQETILSLAQSIVKDAEVLDSYFHSQNLPQPSFDQNGPSKVHFSDPQIKAAQERILSSTKALQHLTQGPATALRLAINSSQHTAALGVIYHFDIPSHVPLDGQISYEDLAKAIGLPRSDLKTILRIAMTDFIFHEPAPGFIAHTAASRILRDDPLMKAWVGIGVQELVPGASKVAESMVRHPGCEEPLLSGWSLANSATRPMFAELAANHPSRAATFARAMDFHASTVPSSTATSALDWSSLGPNATVIDIGGGKGPVAMDLARAFPNLHLIVQDLEEVCVSGRQQLEADLQGRVEFMAHDFFSEQPVKDADVYYFRAVFHNWPDKYCVQILRKLIPALKTGARILIQDPIFPESGQLPPYQDEQACVSDLMMMTLFNSHNREAHEWPELFAKADPRFKVNRVMKNGKDYPLERWGTFEIVWEG